MRIVRPCRDQPSDSSREAQRQYDERYRRYAAAHELCVRRASIWSWTRLVTFAFAVVFLFAALRTNSMSPWGYISVACIVAFVGAVFQHLRTLTESSRQQALATLNAEAGHKLYRRWDKVRRPEPVPMPSTPVELTDLHIVGEGSLTHWLSTVATSIGRQRLMEWLVAPGSAAEIKRRQDAVNELAPALDDRQQFFATSDRVRQVTDDDAGLLQWAQGPLDRMPAYAAVLLLSIGTVAAVIADLLDFTSIHWWLPLVLINVALSMRYGGSIKKELGLVDRANTRLKCYAELIEQATRQRHQTSLLSEIQRQLHFSDDGQIEGQPVNYLIEQLQRRVAMAELRHFGLYYVFAQSLLLWDFHCIRALRGWRSRYGQHIGSWLDALATYEVLCTAASVRHDEPDWCFPDLESGALTFRGIELGHPLISEQGNPELCDQSIAFHFREHIEHEGDDIVMHFDYRLRKGEATSTNALALLKAIGIDDKQSTA